MSHSSFSDGPVLTRSRWRTSCYRTWESTTDWRTGEGLPRQVP